VPVNVLALSLVPTQRMACGKGIFNRNLKHASSDLLTRLDCYPSDIVSTDSAACP
jgi:hypothetical protein